MTTMKGMLETVDGLYRDSGSGRAYRRGELLSYLPPDALDSQVRLRRSAIGVYVVSLDDGARVFDLFSRRRKRRALPD